MNCVIAASKLWDRGLARDLSAQTGHKFVLITDKRELTLDRLKQIDPRYVFFPHWSYIISSDIFTQFECVIFHMTDLPFGRGGSPLQNLIIRGLQDTKISALRCSEGLDTGPIYMKEGLSLLGSAEEIFLRAWRTISAMIVKIIDQQPAPQPQVGTPVLFERRSPKDGNMANLATLDRMFDHIRMLDAEGYPSAFLDIGEFRLHFTRASIKSEALVADVRITKKDYPSE